MVPISASVLILSYLVSSIGSSCGICAGDGFKSHEEYPIVILCCIMCVIRMIKDENIWLNM